MWNTIGSQFVQGLGISSGAVLMGESLLLINQHLFYPALKQVDIQTTKLLWGNEESLKTEYEYKIIEDRILNPIFNISGSIINMAKGDKTGDNNSNSDIEQITKNTNQSTHNLQYTKDGV